MSKRQWVTLALVIVSMSIMLSVAGYFTSLVDTKDYEVKQSTELPIEPSLKVINGKAATSTPLETKKPKVASSPRSTVSPETTTRPKATARPNATASTKATARPKATLNPKTASSQKSTSSQKHASSPEASLKPKETYGSEAEELIAGINSQRLLKGISELKVDEKLMRIAEKKAMDMVTNNYFSHYSVSYGSPFDMMKAEGIKYKKAGENIGGNTSVEKCVNSWIGSPEYNQNVYSKEYNYTGAAVVDSPVYGKIIVQLYIKK